MNLAAATTETRPTRRLRGSVSDVLAGHATHAVECADAAQLCADLPDASVDLMIQDVPYKGVVAESWDNQWRTDAEYLGWLGGLCDGWRRVLKPNGSLYVFASPDMAGRVECVVRERFNVLAHIVWAKHDGSGYGTGGHSKVCKEALRSPFPQTERLIMAEPFGADDAYVAQWMAVKRAIFGDYLRAEIERAGLNNREIAEVTGCYGAVNHGGAVSNWLLGYNLPTAEQYQKLRTALGSGYFEREFSELKAAYDQARADEGQGLRFSELRRPFQGVRERPFTDVWDYATVMTHPGKHPCEKPQEMLRHIVLTSSRPDAVVLDCFTGSGSTGEAALSLGRRFIGGDASEHWAQYAAARLAREFGALPQTSGRTTKARKAQGQTALFGDTGMSETHYAKDQASNTARREATDGIRAARTSAAPFVRGDGN